MILNDNVQFKYRLTLGAPFLNTITWQHTFDRYYLMYDKTKKQLFLRT